MNPWVDANDLKLIKEFSDTSIYQWRDTNVWLVIDNGTSEIIDVYEMHMRSKDRG